MFTFVFAVAFVYTVALFIQFASDRLVARKTPINPVNPAVEAIAPEVVKPKPQSLGSAAVNYESMTCEQLRSVCTERSIPWRNVHGKNKHLRKAEMLALLS